MDLWHEVLGGEDGATTTVLTIHGGLGYDHTYMKRGFRRLAEPHRQIVFYDQRANGRSDAFAASSITMEQLADDAAELLDELGVERAVVLGHSYGGFVAQEFALRHPSRLSQLVLLDTTPGQLGTGEAPDPEMQGPPMPDELIELFINIPADDEEFNAGVRRMLPYYLHDRREPMVQQLIDATEGSIHRLDAMVAGMMALGAWSAVDRLPTIGAPTLLLVGRHDLHTSWPQSYRIASRLPDAEVVVFEHSAHFPWIEEPDRFYDVLERWLAATA
jgi:proline iminopeptidase